MRTLAHLLAVVLIVPQTLIVAAALLLGHLIARRTFFGFVETALDTLDLLLGWGGLAVLLVAALIVGAGFSDRWRLAASAVVLALDLAAAVYIARLLRVTAVGDAIFFFLPGTLAAALCVWIIAAGMPRRTST